MNAEKYLWQGMAGLLAVFDGSDKLLMRFQYADGRMPVAITKGELTHYLSLDRIGTLRMSDHDVFLREQDDAFLSCSLCHGLGKALLAEKAEVFKGFSSVTGSSRSTIFRSARTPRYLLATG